MNRSRAETYSVAVSSKAQKPRKGDLDNRDQKIRKLTRTMRTLPSPEALFGSLLKRPMGKPPWGRILRRVRAGSVTGLAAAIGAGLGLWVGLGLAPNQIESPRVVETPKVTLPAEIDGPEGSARTEAVTQSEPGVRIKKDPEPDDLFNDKPYLAESEEAAPEPEAETGIVATETEPPGSKPMETERVDAKPPLQSKKKSEGQRITAAVKKEPEPKKEPPKEEKTQPIAKAENSTKAENPSDPAKPNIFTRLFAKKESKEDSKKMLARVTVYWANGAGTDKWSAKKQSATGVQLSDGEHAAVDPKVIPFGSSVKIKNPETGETKVVEAVDTGTDVKNRKAAIALGKTTKEKEAPVIDLFFENRSDALAYASRNPHFQWVDIETN